MDLPFRLTTSIDGTERVDVFERSTDAAELMERRLVSPEWRGAEVFLQKTAIEMVIGPRPLKGLMRMLKGGEHIKVTMHPKVGLDWFKVERA